MKASQSDRNGTPLSEVARILSGLTLIFCPNNPAGRLLLARDMLALSVNIKLCIFLSRNSRLVRAAAHLPDRAGWCRQI